jgi:hypothetical protein
MLLQNVSSYKKPRGVTAQKTEFFIFLLCSLSDDLQPYRAHAYSFNDMGITLLVINEEISMFKRLASDIFCMI